MVLAEKIGSHGLGWRKTNRARFDAVIAAGPRLNLCAVLALVRSVRVDVVAYALDATAAELGPHIASLANAGYIGIRAGRNESSRQWISLSPTGRAAYADHLDALWMADQGA
jgi:hypothetical protein